MSDEMKQVSEWVILGGYLILIVGLAWLSLTRKSRRQSRDEGYEHGFAQGERAGYRRYAAEIDGSMQAAVEIAQRITEEIVRDAAPTPRAEWGDQDGSRVEPEPAQTEQAGQEHGV